MKRAFVILILVAAAAGGWWWWKSSRTPETPAAPVVTARVERGPLRLIVSSSGKVVSNLDVDIKCKASGEVIKLPFDVSETVRKGDLILQLDPSEMQRLVDQAGASLAASQARLINARESLSVAEQNLATDRRRADSALKSVEARAADAQAKADRIGELLAKKLASQEEQETALTSAVQAAAELDQARVKMEELKTQDRALEQYRQQIRIAEAQVQNDQVSLDLAREKLNDTKVYAPMDGVVTVRNVQIGTIISSGISNVGGGTTALTVSDLSHLYVLASVDEADIGKVAIGQPVEITVDAFPGKRFKGAVVRIATRGANVSNVVTFEVKIEVTSREKNLLKPEMTANVDIIAVSRESVLMVPAEAILRKGGKLYLSVVKAGQAATPAKGKDVAAAPATDDREVETGISDGQKIEVSGAVNEGETVVVHQNGADSKWSGGQRPRGLMGLH